MSPESCDGGEGLRREEQSCMPAIPNQPVAPSQIAHVRLGGFVDGDGGDLGTHTHGGHWPGERSIVVGLLLTARGPLDA